MIIPRDIKVDFQSGVTLIRCDLDIINQKRKDVFGATDLIDPRLNDNDRVNIYVFLRNGKGDVLAFVILRKTQVVFCAVNYLILEFVSLVSVVEKQGYGLALLGELKKYAADEKSTLIGFCTSELLPFYQKCGFDTFESDSSRFVFEADERSFPGETPGEAIFVGGQDGLIDEMKKHPGDLAYIKRQV